jgi:hypothetical protein
MAVAIVCASALVACSGTGPATSSIVSPASSTDVAAAASAYLAAAGKVKSSQEASFKRHPATTLADAHALYAELAKIERAFSDEVRAIELASADEAAAAGGSSLHQAESKAGLAVTQAANALREDLGLPSVAIGTAGPTASGIETGMVTFGTSYNRTTLLIGKPVSRFSVSATTICYSASFSEPAGTTSVEFIISRLSAGGNEAPVYRDTEQVSDPNADLDAGCADLSSYAGHAVGTYVLRFVHGTKALAAGQFTLTP